MWSDLVQGKPELDDSLSSNAKQMKVASRCFFWFPDDMFVCFSFLGKDSPEKKAKHRKGLQGQNKGQKGKCWSLPGLVIVLRVDGGVFLHFLDLIWEHPQHHCVVSLEIFLGMLINAHPPCAFPLACQHPPKKLFKILLDVVSSFKLQHGNSKLATFEARRHVVEFCRCLISFKTPWCHWILYLVKQSHCQFVSRKYLLFYYRVWNFKE